MHRGYTDYLRIIGGGPPASALVGGVRRSRSGAGSSWGCCCECVTIALPPGWFSPLPPRPLPPFSAAPPRLLSGGGRGANHGGGEPLSCSAAPWRVCIACAAHGSLASGAHPVHAPCWARWVPPQGVPQAAACGCVRFGGRQSPPPRLALSYPPPLQSALTRSL